MQNNDLVMQDTAPDVIPSLLSEYQQVYSDTNRWCAANKFWPRNTINQLFGDEGHRAHEFITAYLQQLDKERILRGAREYRINSFNSVHTLSAFFLGIYLKDVLKLNMEMLPRVYENPQKNFAYFWMLTCLCHDISKVIEEHSSEQSDIDSIDSFYKKYGIHNRLTKNSKDKTLFECYFNYRLHCEHPGIEHGIAGACLLYDAMMNRYRYAKRHAPKHTGIDEKGFTYNGLHFCEHFQKNMLLVANTIAHHNLWRANSKITDNKANKKMLAAYTNTPMECLIVTGNRNKISLCGPQDYARSEIIPELLFLLAITDAIEPIKAAYKMQQPEYISLLNAISIEIIPENTITIHCGSYLETMQKRTADIENFICVKRTIDNSQKTIELQCMRENA